jgi:hypothetical protein
VPTSQNRATYVDACTLETNRLLFEKNHQLYVVDGCELPFGGETLRMEGRSPSWDSWNEETPLLVEGPSRRPRAVERIYRSVR